jgi:predicted DNA-binding transcriptional regulator YafY
MPQGLSNERLQRLLIILAMLPQKSLGKGLSTEEIRKRLEEIGHEIDIRSIQRDMNLLEAAAPSLAQLGISIDSQEDKKVEGGYRWSLLKPLLSMSYEQASALLLAEQILEPMLPTPVIDELLPYFKEARDRFFRTANVIRKEQKVAFLPWGFSLLPPDFKGKQEVVDAIFEALFKEARFKGTYRSRGAEKSWEAVFNPLAYVGREGGGYLVATWGDDDQPRQLLLHRFEKAEKLEESIPERIRGAFRLSEYIKTFAYPRGEEPIRIKLKLSPYAALALEERKVSKDQEIQKNEGFSILTATVDNTEALRWWILGYGGNIEVLEPKELREEIAGILKKAASTYAP